MSQVLILIAKNIKSLGKEGDTVYVKKGYAFNFLFPNKLATLLIKKEPSNVTDKNSDENNERLLERLKNIPLKIYGKSTKNGKLFGSIKAKDIVYLLNKRSIFISTKSVVIESALKDTGFHKIYIKIGFSAKYQLTIHVESSN
jgi:large subunit ribosomal protein L9